MKRFFKAALLVVPLLAGCAGTPIDWSQARKVKTGMSEEQLAETMGKPYLVTAAGDRVTWVYSYADAFAGAKSVSFVLKDGKVVGVPPIPKAFD